MSIIQLIEAEEQALRREIAYWKAQAQHWEKAYNDLVMDTVKGGFERDANMIRAALDGAFNSKEQA